jgi:hypothetical protein
MGDQRAFDRPPRVDIKIARRAVETFVGGFDYSGHGGPPCDEAL